MLIPLVALAIDRLLFWVQRQLFPYQYGGGGLLHRGGAGRCAGRGKISKAPFWKPPELAPVAAAERQPATANARREGRKPS